MAFTETCVEATSLPGVLGPVHNVEISSTVLLAYSHLLLFSREEQHVWKRLQSPATWLYLFMRYPPLVSAILELYYIFAPSSCVLRTSFQVSQWLDSIALCSSYIFQILRTYAISRKSWKIVITLSALALGTIVLNSIQVVESNHLELQTGADLLGSTVLPFNDFASSTDLVFESLVVVVTIWYTWAEREAARRTDLLDTSVAECLSNYGLFFYILILVVRVATFAADNTVQSSRPSQNPPVDPRPSALILNYFVGPLACPIRYILLSEFILELRERAKKRADPSLAHVSSLQISLSLDSESDGRD